MNLNNIVNVVVSVSPVSAVRNKYNIGLIVGTSTHISAATRAKEYSSPDAMIADGWTESEEEYKAAVLYFSQNPKPLKVIIGRWDDTGAETAVQAVTACRSKNPDWYACIICGAVKADIVAVAPYIETASPDSFFFYKTADADAKAGTAGNTFDTLKTAGYRKSLGFYSNDASAPDSVAALMGYAMGANTGLLNSAYTLAYKKLIGVAVDNLIDADVSAIKADNGNVYINRGLKYDLFEQGIVADGTPFDEIINIDLLKNNIQLAVMDLLTSTPKVPQTDDGVSMIINTISAACADAAKTGFIAPGIWNGPTVYNVQTGDALSSGFIVLADTIANQLQADRDARISPPIYVLVKLAGAIEHLVINVLVNR